jgi:hypothetical protein
MIGTQTTLSRLLRQALALLGSTLLFVVLATDSVLAANPASTNQAARSVHAVPLSRAIAWMRTNGAGPDPDGCFPRTYIQPDPNANGPFVSAEVGYTGEDNGMLRARSVSVGPWELFKVCPTVDGFYTIKSEYNNLLVSAEFGYTGPRFGMLRARTPENQAGPWEKFAVSTDHAYPTLVNIESPSSPQLMGSTMVSAEFGYTGKDNGMLRVRGQTLIPGDWERFHTAQQ